MSESGEIDTHTDTDGEVGTHSIGISKTRVSLSGATNEKNESNIENTTSETRDENSQDIDVNSDNSVDLETHVDLNTGINIQNR